MPDDSLDMPEFDKPDNLPPPTPPEIIPLVVPDSPYKRHCIEKNKAGNPCRVPPLKGGDRCLGHSKSLSPELRDQWRRKPKVLLKQSGPFSKVDYLSREEVLSILSKRLKLWMEKFGDVMTDGVDEAICDLARTYAVVAKTEVAENAEIRGWRMKGTA
jgi:hypothetical protein